MGLGIYKFIKNVNPENIKKNEEGWGEEGGQRMYFHGGGGDLLSGPPETAAQTAAAGCALHAHTHAGVCLKSPGLSPHVGVCGLQYVQSTHTYMQRKPRLEPE